MTEPVDVDAIRARCWARGKSTLDAFRAGLREEPLDQADEDTAALLRLVDQQAACIADLTAAIHDVHTRLVVHEAADRCLCPDRDEDTHPVDESDTGAYICDRTPIGAVCAHCLMPDSETADSLDGEHVNWPCPTIRAIDNLSEQP